MWDIIRNNPGGRHCGKAIPIFIRNMQQHLTTIDVYDDGAVDVWGFLDLSLFDAKLQTGWVSTAPPRQSRLSVFNLGMATVSKGEWNLSVADVQERVWNVVRTFNPTLSDIVDMEGSDTRMEGVVRCAKMGLSDDKPYRVDQAGNVILGKEVPLFRRDGRDFHLHQWFIFADGISKVGFDGELVTLDNVCTQIEKGDLTTKADAARWIILPTLGRFVPGNGVWNVDARQRILEARDIVDMLQGGENAISRCVAALNQYEVYPTEENKEELRKAFERVPDHLKMYCGDMDSKDWPIRQIVYPREEE